MPCVMKRLLSGGGALIDLASHWDWNFFSGQIFGSHFAKPVLFDIDVDAEGRRMPTIFTTPAFVARKAFADLLSAENIDNVDVYAAEIRNAESRQTSDDYVLLNIIGLVECADLIANAGEELGPGIRILDEPVLQKQRIPDARIFRLAEDPIQIVVADDLANRILAAGFDDIYFEPLRITL
jgi:hypothetical protein